MKYSPAVYAKAFLETKPDIKKFLGVVAKNGDFARIDKIVEEIEAQETHSNDGRVINVEFARETNLNQKFKFTAKDLVRSRINPSLVAGVRITIDEEMELDGSLQRKLNKLWPTK